MHKNTWQKWFHDSSSFKPVVPSITFTDIVKNNVFMSQKGKNSHLVAVQERSQQRKPPELVKEVSGKTQITHLKGPGQSRLVQNSMSDDAPDDSVQCFNKFPLLSDLEDECYDNMENINQSLVDTCSFAAQDTWGDDLVDSLTRIDKNDKFDTLLVKKKVDQCIITQVKACKG